MSFATEDLVFSTIEPLMGRLMALIGREAPQPFLRMPYAEAIAKYGSDKPDLRCGMEISDLSAAFAESTFAVFRSAIEAAAKCAASSCQARRSIRAASSTSSSSRRSSSARRARVGARA